MANMHAHETLLRPATIGDMPKKNITGFSGPYNLYFTDDGTAYLTEFWGHKIHILDSDGNKLKETSFPGTPTGIHVKDNIIYVADHVNNIVMFRASDLSQIGYLTSPNGPVGVAVDSNGNIYANEYITGKVNVYNKDGSKIREIDMISTGRFKFLRAIRWDTNENLYSSNYFESSIYVSTKEGAHVNEFTLSGEQRVRASGSPFIDDNGNIYLPDRSNGKVYILNSSGDVIKEFQSAAADACDAVIAPDGTLWVVDFYGNSIYLY